MVGAEGAVVPRHSHDHLADNGAGYERSSILLLRGQLCSASDRLEGASWPGPPDKPAIHSTIVRRHFDGPQQRLQTQRPKRHSSSGHATSRTGGPIGGGVPTARSDTRTLVTGRGAACPEGRHPVGRHRPRAKGASIFFELFDTYKEQSGPATLV